MLAHITSSPNKYIASEWTSWETFLSEKYSQENPYSCSFELSNPGAISFTGDTAPRAGLRSVAWAQSPKAGTSAILLQPLGLGLEDGRGRLSMTVSWLKQTLSQQIMGDFSRDLNTLLNQLAMEDDRYLKDDLSFGHCAALLDSK